MRFFVPAAVVLVSTLVGVAGASASSDPVPITVTATPGATARVQRALGSAALRIVRRRGRQIQVIVDPNRLADLRGLPGVAAAHEAPSSFADTDPDEPGAVVPTVGGPVTSEGMERMGADALRPLADDGRGLIIAVLDLGFGSRIPDRQARGELPPAARLQSQSFDAAWGLAGRNAYGNATSHGDLVAQTVYDYAPAARYLFVNYHSEQDFQAAVEWLIAQHADVVVHSNSFLEGPFDGTGDAARAVDRAADAGITWLNSAGNYAQRHWTGVWADADTNAVLDWPITPEWTFSRAAQSPITFALSWPDAPGSEISDLDLMLERANADGSWTEVASSRDRQSIGARPAERITGYLPPQDGDFRLRVQLASGPPPVGDLTLFSREIDLHAIGDPAPRSIPTPGDAAGSITVGAVDWRDNSMKPYSSRGPTADGRLKPDVVAPTNTRVLTAAGARGIGGTSNAAPNAAGAVALLIAARRAEGATPTPAEVADLVTTTALDLGEPGPDQEFGWGRIRVDADPPVVTIVEPSGPMVSALPVRVRADVEDASRLASWEVVVDGRVVRRTGGDSPPTASLGRGWLPQGRHVIEVRATDWAGNVGSKRLSVLVDSVGPRVTLWRVERVRALSAARTSAPRARTARAILDVVDTGPVRLKVILRPRIGAMIHRSARVSPGGMRSVVLGAIPAGRYRVQVVATDRSGNITHTRRAVTLGG